MCYGPPLTVAVDMGTMRTSNFSFQSEGKTVCEYTGEWKDGKVSYSSPLLI